MLDIGCRPHIHNGVQTSYHNKLITSGIQRNPQIWDIFH